MPKPKPKPNPNQARAYKRWVLAASISDPRALGSGAALLGLGCGMAAALATLLSLRGASLVLCLG